MVTQIKKIKVIIIYIIVLTFTLSPIVVIGENPLVFDDAMLFTEEEKVNLYVEVNYLSQSYNMDIVIVTTNDALGKSSREYADDYFDYGGFGIGGNYDGILFLIDMDNREPIYQLQV